MIDLIKRLIYMICDIMGDKHKSQLREEYESRLREDRDLANAIKCGDIDTINRIRTKRRKYSIGDRCD